MKKILIVQPIHEKGMELLKNNSNYSYEVVEDLSVENVKQKIVDADAVSLRTSILPAEAIENAKNLKIISHIKIIIKKLEKINIKFFLKLFIK